MSRPKKSEADVALEMYESVMQSNNKQKSLKSSTFWSLFHVKARHKTMVGKVENLLDKQGLKITVKSGAILGGERDDDWIVLTPKLLPERGPITDPIPTEWPTEAWFETMQTRNFESEREVESYFVVPLLEKLGYEYDDIVIGYPIEMFKGVQKIKTEADFVLFNGPDREKENVLLIIEAKKGDRGINVDHLGQVKSYAQELLPACYIISNGQQIVVYQFNGLLAPDDRIIDFDRSQLKEKWQELYNCISKKATIERKTWMASHILKTQPSVT